jgi:hypothetical protein
MRITIIGGGSPNFFFNNIVVTVCLLSKFAFFNDLQDEVFFLLF